MARIPFGRRFDELHVGSHGFYALFAEISDTLDAALASVRILAGVDSRPQPNARATSALAAGGGMDAIARVLAGELDFLEASLSAVGEARGLGPKWGPLAERQASAPTFGAGQLWPQILSRSNGAGDTRTILGQMCGGVDRVLFKLVELQHGREAADALFERVVPPPPAPPPEGRLLPTLSDAYGRIMQEIGAILPKFQLLESRIDAAFAVLEERRKAAEPVKLSPEEFSAVTALLAERKKSTSERKGR